MITRISFHFSGIIEGYLTRNSINEYYKEFFANGVCLGNPDFCAYMQKQIDINELWLGEMLGGQLIWLFFFWFSDFSG